MGWCRTTRSNCSTSNMPIILQSALVSNMYFIYSCCTKDTEVLPRPIVGEMAESSEGSGQLMPVGGLVYYISPPTSLANLANQILRGILSHLHALRVRVVFQDLDRSLWIVRSRRCETVEATTNVYDGSS